MFDILYCKGSFYDRPGGSPPQAPLHFGFLGLIFRITGFKFFEKQKNIGKVRNIQSPCRPGFRTGKRYGKFKVSGDQDSRQRNVRNIQSPWSPGFQTGKL